MYMYICIYPIFSKARLFSEALAGCTVGRAKKSLSLGDLLSELMNTTIFAGKSLQMPTAMESQAQVRRASLANNKEVIS